MDWTEKPDFNAVVKKVLADKGWDAITESMAEPLRRDVGYRMFTNKVLAPYQRKPKFNEEYTSAIGNVPRSYDGIKKTIVDLAASTSREIDSLVAHQVLQRGQTVIFPEDLEGHVGRDGRGMMVLNALSYAVFRKHLGHEIDICHDDALLRAGLMGEIFGRNILITRVLAPYDMLVFPAPEDAGRFAFNLETFHEEHDGDVTLFTKSSWKAEVRRATAFRIVRPENIGG